MVASKLKKPIYPVFFKGRHKKDMFTTMLKYLWSYKNQSYLLDAQMVSHFSVSHEHIVKKISIFQLQ